ncbi:MAG: flavoprotein [Candidatus Altarchaeaceae archaeon]
MNLLWCITGAGHLIEEIFKILNNNLVKTCAISNAGEEIIRMYGLKLNIEEKIFEREQGKSFPFCGRVSKKEYDKIIVAPCTSNTIAKVANGISDTLITNIITQGLKSGIDVYVFPTDIEECISKIPITIDYEKCKFNSECFECEPLKKCPSNAIYISNLIRINLLKCDACKICIKFCNYGAISFGKEIYVKPRKIDIENIKKIEEQGVKILKNIDEILKLIK